MEEIISLASKWQNVTSNGFTNTNSTPNTFSDPNPNPYPNPNPTTNSFLNQSWRKKFWRNVILRSAK
jgi:hypothetical protein